jgi:hypothetical protein
MQFMAGFFCLIVAVMATVSANITNKPSAWKWVVPITPSELMEED